MRSTARSMVEMDAAGSAPSVERCMNRMKTAWSSTMNVGTPHTSCDSAKPSCSARTVASAEPSSMSSEHLVDGHVLTLQNVFLRRQRLRDERVIVAGSEQRTMDGGEEYRGIVADDDAGLQRDDAGVLLGLFPDTGAPSATCTWPSENARNLTSQSAPAARPVSMCSCAFRAKGQR